MFTNPKRRHTFGIYEGQVITIVRRLFCFQLGTALIPLFHRYSDLQVNVPLQKSLGKKKETVGLFKAAEKCTEFTPLFLQQITTPVLTVLTWKSLSFHPISTHVKGLLRSI